MTTFLQEVTPVDRTIRRSPAAAASLTSRQLEVLRLVAAGLSNRAIADELIISRNTVIRHVNNIFNKIGVANRVEATIYAIRHCLAGEPG